MTWRILAAVLLLSSLGPKALVSACSGRLNWSTGKFECLGSCPSGTCWRYTKVDSTTGLIVMEYCTCNEDGSPPTTCYLDHYQLSPDIHVWACRNGCINPAELCQDEGDPAASLVWCECQ